MSKKLENKIAGEPMSALSLRILGSAALSMGITAAMLCPAIARPMSVMESFPVAQAVVDGRNAQYFVRFDGLVDHQNSRLFITRGGRLIQTLHPRLNAAPEVLFASAQLLQPGDYELHWAAKSMPDGDLTEGSLPFIVSR